MRDKKRRLIHILLTAAGAAICAFFSIPCAVTVVITSAAFMLFYGDPLPKTRSDYEALR